MRQQYFHDYINNHVRYPTEFDENSSDNVIEGWVPSKFNITGVITSNCTGRVYIHGKEGGNWYGFRFENRKIFWDNGVIWKKLGCNV